jgi:hypothetical protein
MSKKRTSSRKPAPAKKVVAPKVIQAKNGGTRPSKANGVKNASPAPAAKALPAVATQDRKLPLWARVPFAIMDFWFSRPERGHGKS